MWLLLPVQGQPVTSECDKDVVSLCLRDKGLDTFAIGEVKQCLVTLGVPEDPSIQLAAEVREVSAPSYTLAGLLILKSISWFSRTRLRVGAVVCCTHA